jgi:hypothetical protein
MGLSMPASRVYLIFYVGEIAALLAVTNITRRSLLSVCVMNFASARSKASSDPASDKNIEVSQAYGLQTVGAPERLHVVLSCKLRNGVWRNRDWNIPSLFGKVGVSPYAGEDAHELLAVLSNRERQLAGLESRQHLTDWFLPDP